MLYRYCSLSLSFRGISSASFLLTLNIVWEYNLVSLQVVSRSRYRQTRILFLTSCCELLERNYLIWSLTLRDPLISRVDLVEVEKEGIPLFACMPWLLLLVVKYQIRFFLLLSSVWEDSFVRMRLIEWIEPCLLLREWKNHPIHISRTHHRAESLYISTVDARVVHLPLPWLQTVSRFNRPWLYYRGI